MAKTITLAALLPILTHKASDGQGERSVLIQEDNDTPLAELLASLHDKTLQIGVLHGPQEGLDDEDRQLAIIPTLRDQMFGYTLDLVIVYDAGQYQGRLAFAVAALIHQTMAQDTNLSVLVHTRTPLHPALATLTDGWITCRSNVATTPVIYRAERAGDFKGQVTAVFPTEPGTNDPHTFSVYAHNGQHSSGARAWYADTRPATEAEYADLHKELQAIGYAPEIHTRWKPSFDTARRNALRASGR